MSANFDPAPPYVDTSDESPTSYSTAIRQFPTRKRSNNVSVPVEGTGGRQEQGQATRNSWRRTVRLWRRWKRMFAVFFVFVAVLAVVLWRSSRRPPLVIPTRSYEPQVYRHLDFDIPLNLKANARVLHVTKEFGPATMGGLGVMLTALATAQSQSSQLSISVALPHYSFLRSDYPDLEIVARLALNITRSRNRVKTVHFPVSLLRWPYPNSSSTPSSKSTIDQRYIDVYLIGPGAEHPFHVAFKAKNEGDIYSAYKPLKQEWKDLYFAKAVSQLVQYLETSQDLDGARQAIDIVHLHGATNAMVVSFLRQTYLESVSLPPAIVYTLHDSLDEVEYSNLVSNVVPFLDPPSSDSRFPNHLNSLRPYIYRSGTQLFTSALGIDFSDVTTFVSHSIASDIVGGRFHFHLQDLVLPSIVKKAKDGIFLGITNGLDLTDKLKNPFTNPTLVSRQLQFPPLDPDSSTSSNFSLDQFRSPLLHLVKEQAKLYLFQNFASTLSLSDKDLSRPWFVFIGRFQYNKGCQFFETLLETLSASPISGRLFLLGARNNYPFPCLLSLVDRYPSHLTLIDDVSTPNLQAQLGPIIRMASDFGFVPSLSEAFGLVAAESLLFGSPLLSSGVGGLTEFLIPLDEDDTRIEKPRGNSYLFDLFPDRNTTDTQGAEEDYSRSAQDVRPSNERLEPARAALRIATNQAIEDWSSLMKGSAEDRETFVRKMVQDALRLGWNRSRGPVEEYTRVYDLALKRRQRLLLGTSTPKVHETEKN
ncbi:hypothetical protein JCM5353_007550 [Sporobolomyces roseus]